MQSQALNELRHYLRAWRAWVRSWRAPLGYPGEAAFVRVMRGAVAWDGSDEEQEIEGAILRAVDASVEDLPSLKRQAIRFIYLRETQPSVYRSSAMTEADARRLCSEAELDLIPRLRTRGVLLGGI